MKRKNSRPTPSELEILSILWERGSATVKEVHEILSAAKPTAYTTVLKFLQIMTDKGLVEPDKTSKAHVYRAVIEQQDAGRTLLGELVRKVFGGSSMRLVQQVLESETTTPEDLHQIRRMIERAQQQAALPINQTAAEKGEGK